MKWHRTTVTTPDGPKEAVAPEVISASRSTDIPAFYSDWLVSRLRQGYVKWINPFNRKVTYVSFERVQAFVFWSKNPRPLIPHLQEFERRHIAYYFQFTINDYEGEKLEPKVPPLRERLDTFRQLSQRLGKHRVVWRFDPLILTGTLRIPDLISRLRAVGDQLHPYTERLVFSFADISEYARVRNSLKRAQIDWEDFSPQQMEDLGGRIGELCRTWQIEASTCGESIDLSAYGVSKNKCVDDELLLDITDHSPEIMALFGRTDAQIGLFSEASPPGSALKDPGQRAECGCVFSKDIGQYNTCPHQCVYCYANTSAAAVQRNLALCRPDSESIVAD